MRHITAYIEINEEEPFYKATIPSLQGLQVCAKSFSEIRLELEKAVSNHLWDSEKNKTPDFDLDIRFGQSGYLQSGLLKPQRTIVRFNLETGEQKTVIFHSLLEARWAYTWQRLGLDWIYEPQKFKFSDGSQYTPDFYLENIGWVEIKPNLRFLHNDLKKFKKFSLEKNKLTSDFTSSNFYIFVSSIPTYSFGIQSPDRLLVQLESKQFKRHNKKFAIETFRSPKYREISEENIRAYTSFVNKTCEQTKKFKPNNLVDMRGALMGWLDSWEENLQISKKDGDYLSE